MEKKGFWKTLIDKTESVQMRKIQKSHENFSKINRIKNIFLKK